MLLFPYHTFMIWNDYGAGFYIWGGENRIMSCLILFLSPWLMPALFVIAGMSAGYSLKKRTTGQFIHERVSRIFLPFIAGLVLLVPFQTLYARKFFYGYSGGITENFKYFFTHLSDFNGYDGCFTFGHLWFLLYLFTIALAALPLMKKISYERMTEKLENLNVFLVILLFIPIFIAYHIGNFGGQSIGKYLLLYLMGCYLFSDGFIEKLTENRWLFLPLYVLSQIILVFLYFKYGYYNDLLVNFTGWLGVLSCLVIGKLYLDRESSVTGYLKRASFPVYILHQTILVIIGYYALRVMDNTVLQAAVIISGSLAVTLSAYTVIGKIPVLRRVIGVK